MGFNLDDYVEVNVRVEKFWADYPEGRIFTKVIKWDGGVVGIKAAVFKNIDDRFPSATGHAYEKENSTFVNKTSYVENCETSAVGRALALMGYEIKTSIASKEEVANAKKQQEQAEKKKPKPKAKSWQVDNFRYTEADVKNLMMRKHNGDKEQAREEWNMFKDMDSKAQVDVIKNLREKVSA